MTVNFSEINRVLAPCSMHILFNSNKFHEFWMGCACKNPLSKDGRNQRRSRPPGTFRADRPNTSTYMGLIFLLEKCDKLIRFKNKTNISYPVGEAEDRGAPEAGRPAYLRPPGPRRKHPRKRPREPTSSRDQEPSMGGRWPDGTPLGRPA